jgi:hypothetical protein
MVKLIFLILFGILPFTNCKSQDTTERKITDTVFVEYAKWPYLNGSIPKHIGITGGFEGFYNRDFEIGICHNIVDTQLEGDIIGTPHIGYNLLYKQRTNNKSIRSIELEIGIFGVFIMGFNFNYNMLLENDFIGFKPFIGLTFFNIELFYGYNFYKNINDPDALIIHNRFTARLYIPTFKLTRKKGNDTFVYEERKFE